MIDYYLRTKFQGELKRYSDYVIEKALPHLEDLESKADAVERAHVDFEGLESFDAPNEKAAERAALAGERYFNESTSLRHTLLSLFVLGLSHLVDQQLSRIHTLLTMSDPDPKPFDDRSPCAAIEAAGVRSRDFRTWAVLTALRSVANVAKHGEGGAAETLRRMRPDLFQPLAFKGQRPEKWLLDRPVRGPLAGDDLYLERADFEKYASAALMVWSELAEAFTSMKR